MPRAAPASSSSGMLRMVSFVLLAFFVVLVIFQTSADLRGQSQDIAPLGTPTVGASIATLRPR